MSLLEPTPLVCGLQKRHGSSIESLRYNLVLTNDFQSLPKLLQTHIYDIALLPLLHRLLPTIPLLPYEQALQVLYLNYYYNN
jgi:hypothetical protein